MNISHVRSINLILTFINFIVCSTWALSGKIEKKIFLKSFVFKIFFLLFVERDICKLWFIWLTIQPCKFRIGFLNKKNWPLKEMKILLWFSYHASSSNSTSNFLGRNICSGFFSKHMSASSVKMQIRISLERNHHHWSTLGDPLSLATPMDVSLKTPRLSLETLIFSLETPSFIWDHIFSWEKSIFSLETPRFSLETLILSMDTTQILVGDPYIFVGDPQILVGDPHIFIWNHIFSMETPIFSSLKTPYFRRRPQIFVGEPQIFKGDPDFYWRSPN